MGIYVEARIRGSMDELWRLTQTPDLHALWDFRFTDVEYLPRPDESQPQQFRYATRIGFGLAVEGRGESAGQRDGVSGERASALRFWSDDPPVAHPRRGRVLAAPLPSRQSGKLAGLSPRPRGQSRQHAFG